MRLIAVGKLRTGPELSLVERYLVRIRPRMSVTEIADGVGAPVEIKRREGAAILAALPERALVVALDLGAKPVNSEAFAHSLQTWLGDGSREVCFVIGGAEGLDGSVMARADHNLSFGALTWPHMLVRVMLAEQIYRARAIAAGHPYHRAGRPA